MEEWGKERVGVATSRAQVCLSLLGTWEGAQGEQWNAETSTIIQVTRPHRRTQPPTLHRGMALIKEVFRKTIYFGTYF